MTKRLLISYANPDIQRFTAFVADLQRHFRFSRDDDVLRSTKKKSRSFKISFNTRNMISKRFNETVKVWKRYLLSLIFFSFENKMGDMLKTSPLSLRFERRCSTRSFETFSTLHDIQYHKGSMKGIFVKKKNKKSY